MEKRGKSEYYYFVAIVNIILLANNDFIEPSGQIARPGTQPGLGVTVHEGEVKKHPFEPEIVERVFYKDGSVGDW